MKAIKVSILFLALIYGCKENRPIQIESNNFELIGLAEGVYGCIHKIGGKAICNAGVIDNGEATFIFDSFLSPEVAGELIGAIEQLDLSPIKYVINSHWHNDHIRGNQAFAPEVKIISTLKTKELIAKWEPLEIEDEKDYAPRQFMYFDSLFQAFSGDKNSREYQNILMWRPYYETLAKSHLEIQTRLPDTFVDSVVNFDGPDRRLQLITKGQGHTESDLVLYLPDDQILFTGDLLFNRCHPYLPNGSLPGWKTWLDFLNSLNVTTIVPGHGEMGTKPMIDAMKDYLTTIESLATKMQQEGLTEQDVEAVPVPREYEDWWFDQFFRSNLRFAFNAAK